MLKFEKYTSNHFPSIEEKLASNLVEVHKRIHALFEQLASKYILKAEYNLEDAQKARHILTFMDCFEKYVREVFDKNIKKMAIKELNHFAAIYTDLSAVSLFVMQNVLNYGDFLKNHKSLRGDAENRIVILKKLYKALEARKQHKKAKKRSKIKVDSALEITAYCICDYLATEAETYLRTGDYTFALTNATEMDYWLSKTQSDIVIKVNSIADMQQTQRMSKAYSVSTKNTLLFKYYMSIGHVKSAAHYLDASLNCDLYLNEQNLENAEKLIDKVIENKQYRFAYHLLDKYIKNLDLKLSNKMMYTESLISACYNMLTKFKQLQLKVGIQICETHVACLNRDLIENSNRLLTVMKYAREAIGNDLLITWEKPMNIPCKHLNANKVNYILSENSLLIRNIHLIKYHQLKAVVNQFEIDVLKGDSDLEQRMDELTLASDVKIDYSETALPSTLSLNATDSIEVTRKEKIKIRKRSTSPELKESCPNTQLERHLRARDVGFTHPENVEVYILSGGYVAPGVHYAYGLQISNDSDKITKDDKKRYQRMLEDGHVVAPKQNGIRVVSTRESGLDRISFKLADRSKDVRILFEPQEQITDSNGKTKFLYRAGKAVWH